MNHLSPELRQIVDQSVTLLGEVIRAELGPSGFAKIEKLRKTMTSLRSSSEAKADRVLHAELTRLRRANPEQNLQTAKAFALMLEVMNVCENAYRSHQIRHRAETSLNGPKPDTVIYVLTAHPTEARSPANIWLFHDILKQLTQILERTSVKFTEGDKTRLRHSLEIAWRLPLVRHRKPRVQDEAEHIYSTLLRDETLRTLLNAREDLAPIFIRSWVGGDKDGHPGVNAVVFRASLDLSRAKILKFFRRRFSEVHETLSELESPRLAADLRATEKDLKKLNRVGASDARFVKKFKTRLKDFSVNYEKEIGGLHPSLTELQQLVKIFPGLVVPLEFRESSDVLLSSPSGKGLAIFGMLNALASISRGGDPRAYVRGFIVSMTSELSHLQLAARLAEKALGDSRLPIIPLFEQAGAMMKGPEIVKGMIKDKLIGGSVKKYGRNQLEIMLGYSDSSKESGVLKSRLLVAETMHNLDHLCRRNKVIPIFFQGSGGSTDRGGGSVQEQTSWWSEGALKNYKVTIQGEMVERSLANPEITRGQLDRIVTSAGLWKQARKRKLPRFEVLDHFADQVAGQYEAMLKSGEFLQLIKDATPYPFLDVMKFGSRPTKRSKKVSIAGLRAIPWILCWTQTRVLFPTWWGTGSAWERTSAKDRLRLKKAAKNHPLFATYVRALGYTLAKVELPIWHLYISESALPAELKTRLWNEFRDEFERTQKFAHAMMGANLIGWRPWLQDSISLRSPMIHPLNLLQIIAMQTRDVNLLRTTVAGISSGMMTTG